ncbi:uncharacterized protein HNO89_001709 [Sporosarcina luteola]|nr:uncharacterized protein [Sporosarcina luteola]
MNLTPTLNNRIESLDMLRGFALLGIFIANMLTFHSPFFYLEPHSWFSTPGDAETFKIINIFVQASFYPLFAMMFGYGLNMQYEKARAAGKPYAPVMARRLAILLLFGLLHALFVWSGDILFTYALMGFVMIAAVRIPKRWIAPIAAAVYLIPTLLLIGVLYLINRADSSQVLNDYVDIQQIELAITAYGHGTYWEAFAFRAVEWVKYGLSSAFMAPFMILPLIMLGAALSKAKLFERAGEWKGRIAIVTIIALVGGIVIKSIPYIDKPASHYELLQQLIGGPILAIGYGGVVLLLFQVPLFRTIFRPISKAGRMSLTTYLTQSIVATLLFNSYGFGLYGKVDLATGTWIAVGLFVIQVIFAELWLMKFRMGPFEWIWRIGTYGKNLPKKEGKAQAL